MVMVWCSGSFGINEAKTFSSGSGGSVDNIGFVIPVDMAEDSLKR